jgi:hypothetical protein
MVVRGANTDAMVGSDEGERESMTGFSRKQNSAVTRGHRRPKDGVLSRAYDPRVHDAFQRAAMLHGLPGRARQ